MNLKRENESFSKYDINRLNIFNPYMTQVQSLTEWPQTSSESVSTSAGTTLLPNTFTTTTSTTTSTTTIITTTTTTTTTSTTSTSNTNPINFSTTKPPSTSTIYPTTIVTRNPTTIWMEISTTTSISNFNTMIPSAKSTATTTSTKEASSAILEFQSIQNQISTEKNLKSNFDAKTWLSSVSENFSELTCHHMNQELLNLTIVEKERCDKQALDFASKGIVYTQFFYLKTYTINPYSWIQEKIKNAEPSPSVFYGQKFKARHRINFILDFFPEKTLGVASSRNSSFLRNENQAWYHSKRLHKLIHFHPLDCYMVVKISSNRASNIKILGN